ncbi:MerR family transcriptional regulator [Clostridium thermobutyricum]|uniref:HTH-type transcriptional activator mta n=1 Tax=Clostridium thermobutyricum DSM 4928 TaxID=1121339 RepID=A0A1V4SRV4_9CLOT|nr:MerR family transcriptional regulator [Clostridium thermobutyricum]OPX46584.1 HTH-type transcriptional activator mta [Clostridium thermobutyricum DSM 4928]
MEYTIKKLGEIAGVSTRTLRYYDQIGLLKPCRINSSGYRIYGEKEVNLLQRIMFYKAMDMKLEKIQEIIQNPNFDMEKSLREQQRILISKRDELDKLIENIEKTIAYNKGEIDMTDKEKFEGFKKEKVNINEQKYGKEIREKYGDKVVDESNKKFLNLTEEEFKLMNETENEMFKDLLKVYENGDLDSKAAKNVYENHKKWLSFSWPTYKKEAHRGLAEMYVMDERFSKYYNDKAGKEVVSLLRDIILKYTK